MFHPWAQCICVANVSLLCVQVIRVLVSPNNPNQPTSACQKSMQQCGECGSGGGGEWVRGRVCGMR